MSDRPEPASPLPWYPAESKPARPYIVGEFSFNATRRHGIARGNPTGGGPFYAAMAPEKHQQDRDYVLWAANNAPKLEARIEQLEAALREIAESRTTKEVAELLGHAGAVGDLSWAYDENIGIARKALQ